MSAPTERDWLEATDAFLSRDASLAVGPDDARPARMDEIAECPDCGGPWDAYNGDCGECGLRLNDVLELDRFFALPLRYHATWADLAGSERVFSRHRTLEGARAVARRERDRPPADGFRRGPEAWLVRDSDDEEVGNLLDGEGAS